MQHNEDNIVEDTKLNTMQIASDHNMINYKIQWIEFKYATIKTQARCQQATYSSANEETTSMCKTAVQQAEEVEMRTTKHDRDVAYTINHATQ